MRRAIVLVGMPRTGSTAFEEVLTRLRPALGSVGICFPKLTPPGSRSVPAATGLPADGYRQDAVDRAALNRLTKALDSTEADVALVFAEDIAGPRPDERAPGILAAHVARFGFAMEVAFVVAPQADRLACAYEQRSRRLAEARTFRGFVRREGFSGRYDHAALLEPWRRAAEDWVRVLPVRDRRSPRSLSERLAAELGLAARLGPLLRPGDLIDLTSRRSGPVAIEASRRLHRLGLHRQVSGHPGRVGSFLDRLAWVRGLDAEPFRGDARQALAAVEAYHGETNERLADTYWGGSWESVVAPAPGGTPNELAFRSVPAETEAAVERLVQDVATHFGYRPPPAWLCRVDAIVEDGIERLAELMGRPGCRVR